MLDDSMGSILSTYVRKAWSYAIYPIYKRSNPNKYEHIGSCFTVKINNEIYLITAYHVVEHLYDKILYIIFRGKGITNNLFPLDDSKIEYIYTSNNNSADIAVIKLSNITDEFLDIDCFSEKNLYQDNDVLKYEFGAIIGSPNSRNNISNYNPNNKANFLCYLDLLVHEENALKLFKAELKANKETHLITKYDKRPLSNGERGNAINPVGISGGALIIISLSKTANRGSIKDNGIDSYIGGVVIGRSHKNEMVLSTKISYVIDIINEI